MKIIITFKHIPHTQTLDKMIRHKTMKFRKFFSGNTRVNWICYSNEGIHYSEVKVIGPHFVFHAEASNRMVSKTFDLVLEKIEKQFRKKKTIWKNHIHHKHFPPLKEKEVVESWALEKEQIPWWERDDDEEAA